METKITKGLTQEKYESYLKARQYEPLYWQTLFPLKNVNSLSAKTLIGDKGSRVAAFVISYDSKSPELSRKAMSTKSFDIPKVSVKRVMNEMDILEQQITGFRQGPDAVLADYYNDADFVVDGCNARMEWFALQALSTGSIQLTTTNNPLGIVNETVIDFGLPAANKKVVSVVWSTANVATMDPIKDFKAVVKAARAKGLKFSKMFMDADAYDLMTDATLFKAYFLNTALSVTALIDIKTINALLKSYNLPEIVLIETSIDIENKAGTKTATNPWSTSHILFVPEVQQGNMYNGPIAEELEKPIDVLQGKNNNVLVSVKRGFDPVNVTTKGECNVFPSWSGVESCYNLYTLSTSTWA